MLRNFLQHELCQEINSEITTSICYTIDRVYKYTHIHIHKERTKNMSTLKVVNSTKLATTSVLTEEIYKRWVCYIDAAPKTVETYTKAIRQFFKYLSDHGILNPERQDIVAYRAYLKEGHKPTTVQNYIAAVKLFFQWTNREGIYQNVAERVKGVKLDSGHKKDYLTSKQAARFLATVDQSTMQGLRNYAILTLMVTTGLRTVSIIRANIEDIRTIGNDTALFYQGKGHEEKATLVKLVEPVENAIRDYLRERGEKDNTAPLFCSMANKNFGERMTTRSISRIVKKQLIAAGLVSDKLTAHSLRHTAATLALLNNAKPEEVQQMLDHQNLNTTLIYSHTLDRTKNNSEQKVARAIFG